MDYAKLIDHTLLKTDAVKKDLEKLLIEAKKYNFANYHYGEFIFR